MMMTMTVAAAGGQWQPLTAWCGAGVRQLEAAETGIKRKWEQYGYDKQKKYLVKLLHGFIFNRTLQHSPFTSIFLALSWLVVIIPSGPGKPEVDVLTQEFCGPLSCRGPEVGWCYINCRKTLDLG
jgi:hypothetical protein